MNEWQPIETAPRGTLVLVCSMKATELRDAFFVDWLVDGRLMLHTQHSATHWMPLPAAPDLAREGR